MGTRRWSRTADRLRESHKADGENQVKQRGSGKRQRKEARKKKEKVEEVERTEENTAKLGHYSS